jgi:G3E family GTPase
MSEPVTTEPALPVILITGYLGSGKTTLLNRLLATAQGRRFAILVNDFGAINIDAALVEGAVDGVVALQNGCICCSLEGGLHAAIVRVLRSDSRPEAILIEASGVSNAGELVRILRDEAMRDFASLELVVTTLDCDYWQSCSVPERRLIESQLRHANVVLLTKSELVNPDRHSEVFTMAQAAAAGALVLNEPSAQVTIDFLLGCPPRGTDDLPPNISDAAPAHDLFRSWQVCEAAALTQAGFQALLGQLPPETVRGKGYVHLADYPATRFLFQMVGKRASVIPSGDWGLNAPQTELVFIALRSQAAHSRADYSLE